MSRQSPRSYMSPPPLFSLFTVQCEKKNRRKLQAKKANKKKMNYAIRCFSARLADASIPPCCCRVPIYKSPRLMCLLLQSNGCEESFFPLVSEQGVATLLLVCFWWFSGFASNPVVFFYFTSCAP